MAIHGSAGPHPVRAVTDEGKHGERASRSESRTRKSGHDQTQDIKTGDNTHTEHISPTQAHPPPQPTTIHGRHCYP